MSEARIPKKEGKTWGSPKSTLFLVSSLALLFYFVPSVAFAVVQITEIMYDLPGADEGREWVEITNKGTTSVDISKFKFREAGVNHKLTLAAGSPVLAASSSAVIANDPAIFLNEHANFMQSVFKSSFSLSNEGETLALINESGKIEYSTTYTATPKPKPAPVVKTPPKSAASSKAKTPAPTSASSPRDLSYTDPANLAAAAGAAQLPPMVVWGAGLGGIIALGTAGALWARMQKRIAPAETPAPGGEFEIQ